MDPIKNITLNNGIIENIIQMVEQLQPANFDANKDLKKDFYEDQREKYNCENPFTIQ